jgi:predicted Zn-dependent protease with MMP-like domain
MGITAAAFERLVARAFEELPVEYRELCDGLAIRTADFASRESLDELGLDDPYELLGLYHGISLARKSVLDFASMPDTVLIYRRPIIAYADATGVPLEDVVRHVLIHEIGHHFGFSDDDMDAIEQAAD